MTGLWSLSEAVLPVSPCPAFSSEELLPIQSRCTGPGPTPGGAQAKALNRPRSEEEALGYVPAPRHYMGSPGKRGGVQRWGGVLSIRATQGVWCYL